MTLIGFFTKPKGYIFFYNRNVFYPLKSTFQGGWEVNKLTIRLFKKKIVSFVYYKLSIIFKKKFNMIKLGFENVSISYLELVFFKELIRYKNGHDHLALLLYTYLLAIQTTVSSLSP